MQIKKGIPVSPGVAISRALVIDAQDQPIPRHQIPRAKTEAEHVRLKQALAKTTADLEALKQQATESIGAENAKIFLFHLGMLQDKHLLDQFKQMIDDEQVTAEYAVYRVMRRLAKVFKDQQNRYFRERVTDVWDLERQILGHLIGQKQAALRGLDHEAAVVAHDLTPSQTASLDPSKVKGLATDAGGRTSHTAILAHALGIPAVVGVEGLTALVDSNDSVIIDGNHGLVIIEPDAAKLLEYRQELQRMAQVETSLVELAPLPADTKDGTHISLLANIEFPNEIGPALDKGAEGIGLYRTEFLYLAADHEPTEDEQYEAYAEVVRSLEGRPLTFRTLDLGADKAAQTQTTSDAHQRFNQASEPNPFLGCRSIRLCLLNLPMFKRQLRAILRASTHGPLRIMFPLISNIMELRQAKMILQDVMEDLDEQGIKYTKEIPVGVMVEVPSAALQAQTLGNECDFFSIGTNDLIQYTVAVDRSNERIASLYSGAHPAVIQLIRGVISAGKRSDVDISLCGEMGGQPEFTMLLIGMGLRSLSITPPAIPEVKQIVRSVSVEQCKRVARKVATFDTDRAVINYLRGEVYKVVPELIGGRSIE